MEGDENGEFTFIGKGDMIIDYVMADLKVFLPSHLSHHPFG